MNFNEKMRKLRNDKGLTQEQACKQIGIAISSLRNYEQNRFPDAKQLRKIKDFYDVPYEYLLNDDCNTANESNIKIGEKLGIKDESIYIIQQFSKDNKIQYFDEILQSFYSNDLLDKFDEYINITYITNTILSYTCKRIEFLLKSKNYNDINHEDIKKLEFFKEYNVLIKKQHSQEDNYLSFLLVKHKKKYYEFLDSLLYLIPTIDYNSTLDCSKMEGFYLTDEIIEIFNEYREHLEVKICSKTNNDFKDICNKYIIKLNK